MRSFPSFNTLTEWLSYQKLLINRLEYLKTANGKTNLPSHPSVAVESVDKQEKAVLFYLNFLSEWMEEYGVSLDWLFEIDNSTFAVMQPDKQLSAKEQEELTIICERFQKKLMNTNRRDTKRR